MPNSTTDLSLRSRIHSRHPAPKHGTSHKTKERERERRREREKLKHQNGSTETPFCSPEPQPSDSSLYCAHRPLLPPLPAPQHLPNLPPFPLFSFYPPRCRLPHPPHRPLSLRRRLRPRLPPPVTPPPPPSALRPIPDGDLPPFPFWPPTSPTTAPAKSPPAGAVFPWATSTSSSGTASSPTSASAAASPGRWVTGPPLPLPGSRDRSWFANVPSKKLSVTKAEQNWVRVEGDWLVFPGGRTSFSQGVK